MEDMINTIDSDLWQAFSASPFNAIDYEYLLATDPSKIREEEMELSLKSPLLEIPQPIDVTNIDLPSSDKHRRIRVRTYRPKGGKNLPVLLYFHGGAFIYGTPEQYDFLFFSLVQDLPLLVVSVDYRLAPENPFPAGWKDGCDVLRWLSENADDLGGNRNNIMIGGSSAGATIAASVTHWARDQKNLKIRHQYLLYPPMSHILDSPSMNELKNAPLQTRKAAEWMWKHYLQSYIADPPKYAVPLSENNFKDLPDATIIICELDPLRDEGIRYAEKLKEAGVAANVVEIKGAVHAFDFFPCPLSDTFYRQQVALFKQIVHKNNEENNSH